ncbi:LppU/SCO3897 family protein [Plantactinospora sp. WMMC1484]|uniref:LppU/SCO3897 family protein n=1 Tax=Plantactinospora sp. WMMC1484 TaxID=3404122 RepID=UPI003BF4DDE6
MANYGPPGGPGYGSPSQPWNDPDRPSIDEYGQPVDPWGDQDQSGGAGHWGGGQTSAPPGGPGSPVSYPGYPAGYPASPGPGPAPISGPPGGGYPPTRRHDVGSAPAPHRTGGSGPFDQPQAGWTASDDDPVWATPVPDPSWSTSAPDPMPKGGGNRTFAAVLVGLAVLVFAGAAVGIYLFSREDPSSEAQPPASEQTEEPAYEPSVPAAPAAPTTAAAEPSTDARFVKAGQCVQNEGTEAAPKLAITTCAPQTYEVLARYNGATTGATDAKAKCARVQNYTNFYFFNSDLDELDFVLCLRKR